MATIEKTESCKIEYKDNQIVVTGSTFVVTLPVDTAKLASIYMTGTGEADATISVEVEDPVDSTTKSAETETAPAPKKKRQKKVKTLAEVKANQVENKWNPDG